MSYKADKNELQMAKSKIVDKLFKELTPEKIEEMRLKRIARTKALTMEYQLGWYVGEMIVSKKLPTLNVDMLQTRNCIKVSNDEELEAELTAFKKQLDNLEHIESNKHILHHESLKTLNDKPQQSYL